MSERDMQRLIAVLERALGKDWIEIVEWLRDQNTVDAIEARIRANDFDGVIVEVEAAASRFAAGMHEAYVTAGQKAATWLDGEVSDSLVRFDQTNSRAVLRARQNEYDLIRDVSMEQRQIVRNVVSDGMVRGVNPREMARDLRDSIGLTPYQEQIVRNYRRALEGGDYANALGRELRDGRSDRMLRRLARADEQLPPEKIDALVERYRQNWIGYRAEVIARTEALRAAHEGSAELFRQAIERGDVDAGELIKEWNAGPHTRHARAQHQAMERRDPIGVLEDFILPDGTPMKHPGDQRGGAKHNAQCRCNASTRYVEIDP